MTFTATYNDDLSRIQLEVTEAPTGADFVRFERSTDQITWLEVRGGQTVGLTSGAGSLNDYEFVPGVLNYYRASYTDSGDIAYVDQGTASYGDNTSTTPGLPAGLQPGDMMLLHSAITTGSTVTPAGWTLEIEYGPMAVFTRRYQTDDTAPTVTYSGGIAGASTSSVIHAWRNMQPGYTLINGTINTSAQNIVTPPLTADGPRREYALLAWKQDGAASSASMLTPFDATETMPNANGGGQSLFFSRVPGASDVDDVPGQTMTVTGGEDAISRTLLFTFRVADYIIQESTSATPAMNDVWLKNVLRPNLNRRVNPVQRIEVTRKSRSGLFDIVGRTMPIAVTDVRGSREFDLTLWVESHSERDELDNTLATGDTMYLHIPPGGPTTSAYVLVGDTSWSDTTGLYRLPLTEVATPDGTLVGNTILWLDVTTTYATWADVIADEPTWSDLLSQIAPGDSVIVP